MLWILTSSGLLYPSPTITVNTCLSAMVFKLAVAFVALAAAANGAMLKVSNEAYQFIMHLLIEYFISAPLAQVESTLLPTRLAVFSSTSPTSFKRTSLTNNVERTRMRPSVSLSTMPLASLLVASSRVEELTDLS